MIRGEAVDGPIEERIPRIDSILHTRNVGSIVLRTMSDFANNQILPDTTSAGNGAHSYRFTTYVEDHDARIGRAIGFPSADQIKKQNMIKPIFFTVDRDAREVIDTETTAIEVPLSMDSAESILQYAETEDLLNYTYDRTELMIFYAIIQKSKASQETCNIITDLPVYLALTDSHKTLDYMAKEYPNKDESQQEETKKDEWIENWQNFEDVAYEVNQKFNKEKNNIHELAIEHIYGKDTIAIKLTGKLTGENQEIFAAEIIQQKPNETFETFYTFANGDNERSEDNYDEYGQDLHLDVQELCEVIREGSHISPNTFDSYRTNEQYGNLRGNTEDVYIDGVKVNKPKNIDY